MSTLAFRLIERYLPSTQADAVIGDLVEREVAGVRLWREALVAIWQLRDRTQREVELMSTFLADLRLALRMLGRAPTFAATAIITLGIAIGAATAIFSVANPVIISPLPYRNPDRVVVVWEKSQQFNRDNVGFLTYRDFAERATSFENAAAVGG